MKSTTPTDLKISDTIYNMYYKRFATFRKEDQSRNDKIYVPIDIDRIANELKIDPDIIFGRLYYRLNKIHSYKEWDEKLKTEIKTDLFANMHMHQPHCIHFPLMASILADLKDNQKKFLISTWISIISLVISSLAFSFSLLF
jgi:hypothetical protein